MLGGRETSNLPLQCLKSNNYFQEPEVEFQAESQFEGKNLPQLTSLITSHLRKSLQKKHTLPSYNVRHSPFFEQLSPQDETQEVYVHNGLVTVGALEVTVLGCSRLPELENWAWQYCSLSVDLLPWSRLAERKRATWPTFEVCCFCSNLIMHNYNLLAFTTTFLLSLCHAFYFTSFHEEGHNGMLRECLSV